MHTNQLPAPHPQVQYYVERYLPDANASSSAGGSVNYQMTSVPLGTTPENYWRFASFRSSFTISYRASSTPFVTAADHSACTAIGQPCQISLRWSLGMGTNALLPRTYAGNASAATVEVQAGSTVISCENATITASAISGNSYNESLTCQLGGSPVAGGYTIWLCYPDRGCAGAVGMQYASTVSGHDPVGGSGAGGSAVTITGTGAPRAASLAPCRLASPARSGPSACTCSPKLPLAYCRLVCRLQLQPL
jgi:hypothetical protein